MAAPASLQSLLDLLSQSLNSALEATPKISQISPPENGLSLLDVKNDLLLSYLQNLVFLILLKIRNAESTRSSANGSPSELRDSVVTKLAELRLYIEKGARPLEEKLRYQIEKALRAAEDAENAAQSRNTSNGDHGAGNEDSDSDSGSSSEEGSGHEKEGNDEDGIEDAESQARPNRAAFVRPSTGMAAAEKSANGAYRPPRIAPTTMPTTERRERSERRPMKSATMDEFIVDELSTAPMAEPSIGTNIRGSGRQLRTERERKEEQERVEYEERNFVRLPKETKKERAKKAKAEGRTGRMNFGGEEWRGLDEGVDRHNRLTTSKSSGAGTQALLDKSRKRGIDTVDGPRSSGGGGREIGERYQKRLKLQERGRGGKKRR